MAKKTVTTKGIRFETYPDVGNQYRWRMVDGNNRIVGVSGEGFTREKDARRAVENIKMDLAGGSAPVSPAKLVGK